MLLRSTRDQTYIISLNSACHAVDWKTDRKTALRQLNEILSQASIINVSEKSIDLFFNFQNEKALKIKKMPENHNGSDFNRLKENQQSFLVFKTYLQLTFRYHSKQSPKQCRSVSPCAIIIQVVIFDMLLRFTREQTYIIFNSACHAVD